MKKDDWIMNEITTIHDKIPEPVNNLIWEWANNTLMFADPKLENKIFKEILIRSLLAQKEKMNNLLKALKEDKTDLSGSALSWHDKAWREINNQINVWYSEIIKKLNGNEYEIYLFYNTLKSPDHDDIHQCVLQYRSNELNGVSTPFAHVNTLINEWERDLKDFLEYFLNKRNTFSTKGKEVHLFNPSDQAEILTIASINPLYQYFANEFIYQYLNLQKDENGVLDLSNLKHKHATYTQQRADFVTKLDDNINSKNVVHDKSSIKSMFKN